MHAVSYVFNSFNVANMGSRIYLGSRSRGIVSYPEFWVKLIVYLEGRLGTSVGRYAGDTWCSGNTAGVFLVL